MNKTTIVTTPRLRNQDRKISRYWISRGCDKNKKDEENCLNKSMYNSKNTFTEMQTKTVSRKQFFLLFSPFMETKIFFPYFSFFIESMTFLHKTIYFMDFIHSSNIVKIFFSFLAERKKKKTCYCFSIVTYSADKNIFKPIQICT